MKHLIFTMHMKLIHIVATAMVTCERIFYKT